MNGSLRLGKIWGININLHFSWFIILALITGLLYYSFPEDYHPLLRVMAGMGASVFLFASVTAHELAHSIVAIRNGIPVKSITLFFLGGVAHITQEAKNPATEFKMAVAGPLCSLALAGFFGLMWFLIWGHNQPVSDSDNSINPVLWLALMNLILALFNLIPGFPLDGGRILRALLWWRTGSYSRATRVASITGIGFARLLIGGGVVLLLSVFFLEDPLFIYGLQCTVVGIFLHSAVSTNYRQMEMRESLRGLTAQAVMSPGWVGVPPDISLKDLAQAYILTTGHQLFVVTEEGRMLGVITLEDMKKVPQAEWDRVPVRSAMTPSHRLVSTHPQEEALSILQRMDEQGLNQMPVMRDGAFVGMVFRHNLLRFIQLRTEFKV
ncbi:site-2 protease family protein [Chloroflexota bacterium]